MTSWAVRGVRVDQSVLAGLVFCLAFLAAAFTLFAVETGKSPGQYLLEHEQTVLYLEDMKASMTAEQLQQSEPVFRMFEQVFDFIFAWIGVWLLTGLTVVATFMSRSALVGAPEAFPVMDQTRVVIPDKVVYVFIAAGLMTLMPVDGVKSWCYNILIILVFIYFLGGLSILSWFLNQMGVPLAFKILLYVLVMIYWPFSLVTAGAGLFDQWFDFRKLRRTD